MAPAVLPDEVGGDKELHPAGPQILPAAHVDIRLVHDVKENPFLPAVSPEEVGEVPQLRAQQFIALVGVHADGGVAKARS